MVEATERPTPCSSASWRAWSSAQLSCTRWSRLIQYTIPPGVGCTVFTEESTRMRSALTEISAGAAAATAFVLLLIARRCSRSGDDGFHAYRRDRPTTEPAMSRMALTTQRTATRTSPIRPQEGRKKNVTRPREGKNDTNDGGSNERWPADNITNAAP